jgi:hypothetical protein
MDSSKEEMGVTEQHVAHNAQASDKEVDEYELPARYRGTEADKRDMLTLGKKQVLRVCVSKQSMRNG